MEEARGRGKGEFEVTLQETEKPPVKTGGFFYFIIPKGRQESHRFLGAAAQKVS
jgi:hypothetical protein